MPDEETFTRKPSGWGHIPKTLAISNPIYKIGAVILWFHNSKTLSNIPLKKLRKKWGVCAQVHHVFVHAYSIFSFGSEMVSIFWNMGSLSRLVSKTRDSGELRCPCPGHLLYLSPMVLYCWSPSHCHLRRQAACPDATDSNERRHASVQVMTRSYVPWALKEILDPFFFISHRYFQHFKAKLVFYRWKKKNQSFVWDFLCFSSPLFVGTPCCRDVFRQKKADRAHRASIFLPLMIHCHWCQSIKYLW